jgi:hypothetical protein
MKHDRVTYAGWHGKAWLMFGGFLVSVPMIDQLS